MLSANNISLRFGDRVLFDRVNIKFTKGNCYGLIGANGSGKSSFLKILYGDLKPSEGNIDIEKGIRISYLKQYNNTFDKYSVLDTVIMGDEKLFNIKNKINHIYSKSCFSEKDGLEVAHLTSIYEDIGGWDSENKASDILFNLGIDKVYYNKLMSNINNKLKIRILLAQSIFRNPDVLILDEPTNGLDIKTITWLENFLSKYENTIILVSHDRHFLDCVCTHICDLDFEEINLFTGNYTFWYESSQLVNKQKLELNKKIEDKRKELMNFIQRFSSNASKSRQATSRKKILEKLTIDQLKASSRRYPFIVFKESKKLGNQVLEINNLSKIYNKKYLFQKIYLSLNKKDKIAILSKDSLTINHFFNIIMGYDNNYEGSYKWGITVKKSYMCSDNTFDFCKNIKVIDWLKQYVKDEASRRDDNIRSLLGKMLFSGESVFKNINLLSGGERMRCMISKMIIEESNILLLNDPTKHLDIETITSLNKALTLFSGVVLISSKDHQLLQTICNRVLEITPQGIIDETLSYDDYIQDEKINLIRKKYYEY